MAQNQSVRLQCTERTEFGKGSARRIRREGDIPAVIYGHGELFHITLPGHDGFQALKTTNALLTLEWNGGDRLALARDIQRDPLKPIIKHVDLAIVNRDEKVEVEVGVHVEGEAGPETVVSVSLATVAVEAPVMDIPEWFSISVEGAEAGTLIHAGEIDLPKGVTLVTDPEEVVVNISEQISQEAMEAELAEAEAEAGIEADESEDEAAEEGGESSDASSGEDSSESGEADSEKE